ncbi:MAG: DNA recombination protein RmuC [Planctomycetes bacterium]|nr:DNA recombination protein RmuC [Planctomycetota bacterium]
MVFAIGVVVGAAVAFVVSSRRARADDSQMREAFAKLAGDALDANARRLGDISAAMLDGKKELIDKSVAAVNERLEQVRQSIQRIEVERKGQFSELKTSVTSLSATTGKLHEMLASTQRRGAWGERMAEDILQLAGMQKGVNYSKQSGADAESGRPDFTFFLPNNLKVNMDVKFPLESYKTYIDASDEQTRGAALQQLVRDVRGHIKAVASRGYIDPSVPTVPYVIVFLASEQVYSLALAGDADLMDEALRLRVVLAGPMTLYAMLAVMRQAAENANLMKTTDEVLSVLAAFTRQWGNYTDEFDKLGQYLDRVNTQYDLVRNRRTKALQRPLDKIEQLRDSRGADKGDPD